MALIRRGGGNCLNLLQKEGVPSEKRGVGGPTLEETMMSYYFFEKCFRQTAKE